MEEFKEDGLRTGFHGSMITLKGKGLPLRCTLKLIRLNSLGALLSLMFASKVKLGKLQPASRFPLAQQSLSVVVSLPTQNVRIRGNFFVSPFDKAD